MVSLVLTIIAFAGAMSVPAFLTAIVESAASKIRPSSSRPSVTLLLAETPTTRLVVLLGWSRRGPSRVQAADSGPLDFPPVAPATQYTKAVERLDDPGNRQDRPERLKATRQGGRRGSRRSLRVPGGGSKLGPRLQHAEK
jgi:hypothetical protein